MDPREMAEEQGWVARMVHLFQSDDLATQFEVSDWVWFPFCDTYSGSYCKQHGNTLRMGESGYDIPSHPLSLPEYSSHGGSSYENTSYVVLPCLTKVQHSTAWP